MPQELNLLQGSPEWLQYRRLKVTASEMPAILGKSPYETTYQCYQRKMQDLPTETNWAMQKGHEREKCSRKYYENALNLSLPPKTYQSTEHTWLMASLDGVNEERQVIFETKYNALETHEKVKEGIIPEHHQIQLQTQMLVMQYAHAFYVSYRDEQDMALVVVERDEELIAKIIQEGYAFYKRMLDYDPPEPDMQDLTDSLEMQQLLLRYDLLATMVKTYENELDFLKKLIIEKTDGKSAQCGHYQILHYPVRGRINYAKIPELKNIDLEPYRSPSTTATRIILGKNDKS